MLHTFPIGQCWGGAVAGGRKLNGSRGRTTRGAGLQRCFSHQCINGSVCDHKCARSWNRRDPSEGQISWLMEKLEA